MKQPVHCLHCKSELGYYDTDLLGIKFFKWRLQLPNLKSSTPPSLSISESPNLPTSINKEFTLPSSIFVTSKILSKMSSHLISKFLLTPTSSLIVSERHPICLLLWIFGTSLRFSCSRYSSKESKLTRINQPAIKAFWKLIPADTANKMRDSVGIEELPLPVNVIMEIRDDLSKNSSYLPPYSRKFQDWHVGLLDRFE